MQALKYTLIAGFWALPAAALACDCPDKPMPPEVLAPQIQDYAEAAPKPIKAGPAFVTPSRPERKLEIAPVEQAPIQQAPVQQVEAPAPEPGAIPVMTPEALYGNILQSRITASAGGLNSFDYATAKRASDAEIIGEYIADLEQQNPDVMTAPKATAYWANLYNAVTLKLILDNYPVKSIRKIKRPWKTKLVTVSGRAMTLDEIEHKTLRAKYPSPYIHYMVNCASIGCPNLRSTLWTAEGLDAAQKQAARDYINSPRGVRITEKGLRVSSIYKWFDEDFGGNKAGVLKHIREHADADLAAAIDGGAKIVGYDYDWTLNE